MHAVLKNGKLVAVKSNILSIHEYTKPPTMRCNKLFSGIILYLMQYAQLSWVNHHMHMLLKRDPATRCKVLTHLAIYVLYHTVHVDVNSRMTMFLVHHCRNAVSDIFGPQGRGRGRERCFFLKSLWLDAGGQKANSAP